HLRLAADHGPDRAAVRAPGRLPTLPGLSPGRLLMAGCGVLYFDPPRRRRDQIAHPLGSPEEGWWPCTAPGQAWIDPDLVLRWVCTKHRRQLIALHAAGLADQVRWQQPGLATGPAPTREATP